MGDELLVVRISRGVPAVLGAGRSHVLVEPDPGAVVLAEELGGFLVRDASERRLPERHGWRATVSIVFYSDKKFGECLTRIGLNFNEYLQQ